MWNTGNKWEIRENDSDHITPLWGTEWRWAYQIIPSSKKWHHSSCFCCPVTQSCPTLCDLVDGSMPGFPVLHYLPRFAQTHVHWVDDAIQQFHLLSPPSFLDLNLSQHQGLFQWVSSSNQVVKVLQLQLQHQSFQ